MPGEEGGNGEAGFVEDNRRGAHDFCVEMEGTLS
jgi:hypothetical protein